MNLGKFEILDEVGHGGFGTVYRANDTTLDRIIALKVLHDQYNSDQKFIESFKREAKLMAKITHPNVVQILEVGDLDGQIYIAMQYFDGGSLEQKIQSGGPLTLRDAIRMLNQVARGLEAGHKIGLIHRDIKPANILYNQDGFIAISDFGVAKSIQQGSVETTNSFNQFAGSPYYIPPELWQSKGNTSPAADVYSLACVFYEALTGEILFAGNTYEHVLTRHVLEAPVFSNSLSENLVDLLSIALAKNPSDRYQTMNDFLMATRAALESKKTKTDKKEQSENLDLVSELPKPLSPGEITFDQLVKQSQRRASPPGEIPEPIERTPPARVVVDPRNVTVEPPQTSIKSTPPAQEAVQPLTEVPTHLQISPQPQPNSEKPELKPGSVNFKPFADASSVIPDKPTISPVFTPTDTQNQDLPTSGRQAAREKKAQSKQTPVTNKPKKKGLALRLLIAVGIIGLAIGLVASFFFLRSNNLLSTLEATQVPTATATVTAVPTNIIRSTQFREKDSMWMVYVPAGEFEMGNAAGEDDEKPLRQVYLDDYWIDKYEVTNWHYERCVSEGACIEPAQTGSSQQDDYYYNPDFSRNPVIHVSWYQARDYCQWAGGDLPTEAQWEKAARGVDGRVYPWGNNNPDSARANFDQNTGDTMGTGWFERGESPYGAQDMAGNVWEWVLDWYGPYDPADTNNPLGPNTGEFKVFRGGSWKDNAWDLRTTSRYAYEPSSSDYNTLGFRCAFPAENSQLSSTLTPSPTSEFSIGSTMFRELDGMEMVFVPEGNFKMGSTTGGEDEAPIHRVYLDAFWIDKFEVTNAQYAMCVANGACSAPANSSSASRGYYYGNPTYSNFPVVYMKWSQAYEYCQWVGGNLPTEAQWEKTARGTDGRKYPWGEDPPDETMGNYDFDQGNSLEVGSYPQSVSPYGALDMAGNVWEWVWDWYGPYDIDNSNNPIGPSRGDVKVMRGGCWYNATENVTTSYRGGDNPNNTYYSYGFRCVVTP